MHEGLRQTLWPSLETSLGALKEFVNSQLHVWSFLVGVVVCGLIFGGVVAGEMKGGDASTLVQTVDNLLTAVSQHQLAASSQLWWQRTVADIQVLALLWLFGVSVIGLPLIVIVLFLRSFSVGFAVGFTVIDFGWKGFLVAALGIFSHEVIALALLIIAGAMAIRFSASLLQQVYPLSALSLQLLHYTGLFFLCAAGFILSSGIEAYTMPRILTAVLGGGV